MNPRICVAGPRDPLAGSGLGFDVGPLIDTISAAGSKYLDYKTQKDVSKLAQANAQLALLQQQRAQIAGGAGVIGGGTLALAAVAAFFLLSRRR